MTNLVYTFSVFFVSFFFPAVTKIYMNAEDENLVTENGEDLRRKARRHREVARVQKVGRSIINIIKVRNIL